MRKTIMMICSGILIGYSLLTLVAVSAQFGNMVILFAGILLGLDAFFYRKMNKTCRKLINGILVTGLVLVFFLSTAMLKAAYGHTAAVENTNQTLVILGAKVNGNSPSLMLSRRLRAGLDYADDYPQCKIIVTGGQGSNETVAEGVVMKQWLVDHGVEEERIIVEDQAVNTGENLKYTAQIISENELNPEIVIATDSFHQLRARILAHISGLEKVQTVNADTPLLFRPMYFVREWFGLLKAVLFHK